MKTIYILDTNALLYNPQLIFTFSKADVIVPQAVLIELDRLKLSSVDSEVKFRGREVSRALFELSEKGRLLEGIALENGATFKVVSAEPSQELPPFLSLKSTDDQILAVAYQVTKARPKDEITLISNDLNMLLKAQALGIKVQRYQEKDKKRFFNGLSKIGKGKQARLFWLVVVLIAAMLAYCFAIGLPWRQAPLERDIPPELKAELEAYENQKAQYEKIITNDPDDFEALAGLGNLYFDSKQYRQAVDLYERALLKEPKNANIRTDLAIAYFNLGLTDVAIKEVRQAIKDDSQHAYAHYNLGNFLWRGKSDLQGAVEAFQKYLELNPQGALAEEAKANIKRLEQLKQE